MTLTAACALQDGALATTKGRTEPMQIAIREGMAPGKTLQERLTWLETVDIDGIELHAGSMQLPLDEVREVFAGSSRKVSAIEGIPRLLAPEPAVREEAKVQIRERLALAGDLGAVGVLIVPQFGRGPALPDLSPWMSGEAMERELLLSQLLELSPVAEAHGVKLFLEPLNRYEAYMVNRVEQGAELAALASPQVATMADFFHMGIEEVDIAAAIRDNAAHVIYVHVADTNRAQPGFGHHDFRPGFAALKEIGYDGWLVLECSRIVGEYDAAIREAVAHLCHEWATA
jgi:sugar phosphate isomerase/epimerase